MALPKDVQSAVAAADAAVVGCDDTIGVRQWQIIRAHLLSQDAEIERLSQESAQQFIRARDWAELSGKNEDRASLAESRLAAAKAEIEQLQAGLAKHVNRVCELQDRLAAANALLRDIKDWDVNQAQGTYLMVPLNLRKRIQAHLSENTHDRA